jgi:methylglutamate dehydrogenase subunit D
VAEPDLIPRSGLEHLAVPGRHGAAAGEPGVVVSLRTDLALVAIMARKGRENALAQRVREVFGAALPQRPRRAENGPVAFVWAGPGQWLASARGRSGHVFESELRESLAGLASVTDQSDARAIVRVSGPKARDALAKGVPIDLHPGVFGPGDTALTVVSYIGVHIWQIDETPNYEIAMFRSFADSFWRWLLSAGAEYGMAVSDWNAKA